MDFCSETRTGRQNHALRDDFQKSAHVRGLQRVGTFRQAVSDTRQGNKRLIRAYRHANHVEGLGKPFSLFRA